MFPMFTTSPSCQRHRRRPCNMERSGGQFWPFVATSGPFTNMNFESDFEAPVNFYDLLRTFSDRMNNSDEKMNKAADKKENTDARNGSKDHATCSNSAECEQSRQNGEDGSGDSAHHRQEPKMWRQEVDCKGFKSRSIRVKIDARLLLIKANQVEESEFGVQTSSMRKSVPLPENIDRTKITCKLSPKGKLIVQAPFVSKDGLKDKPDGCQFFKDLMSVILPGIEHTLLAHFGDDNSHKGEHDEKDAPKETHNDETQNEKSTASTGRRPENAKKQDEVEVVPEENPMPGEDDSKTCDKHQTRDKQDTSEDVTPSLHDPELEKPTSSGDAMVADHDNESVNTEDSFVLLSELEKEEKVSTPTSASKICENGYVVDLPIDDDIVVNDEENEAEKTPEVVKMQKLKPAARATYNNQAPLENTSSETVDTRPNSDDITISSNHHGNDTRDDRVSSSSQESTTFKDETKDQDGFQYRVEMPSHDPETICVNFDEGKRLLVISASKASSNTNTGDAETITKRIHVDEDIDVNGLRCYFRDGCLSVTAPRKSLVKNIPVLK